MAAITLLVPGTAFAQTADAKKPSDDYPKYVRSSPAFAEVVFGKTVLEADLEELRIRYTEDFPRVAEMKYEIEELDLSLRRLSFVPEEEASKLTLALGKLMVRKAELARELFSLKRKYNDSHPEVKRAEKKLGIFENAVKTILGDDL